MNYRVIKTCRLCNSQNLSNLLDFGMVPLGNNLQKSKEISQKVKSYPLIIKELVQVAINLIKLLLMEIQKVLL